MEPPALAAGPAAPVRAAPGASADLVLPPPKGTQPFTYRWSRAGASLDDRFTTSDDAGGVRLTVSAAQTGDSGVYTLQASNAAGSDTSKIRLEVAAEEAPIGEDPPTFLRRLQDLTVKVGSRTRFLVEIISSTECKVTWYRNERRLLEAERVALARDGNFWCADVAAVSVDDAGRWTCTAENAGGRASCSAHLNVLVPKAYKRPEFVEELRALLTEQGTVSLECKVIGVPTPVLRWFKDSREIKAGDVFALTANAEDPTSLGTYTCEAVNCMGRAYSSSKVHVVGRASREGSARPSSSGLTPEPPPIFTKELEDAHVKVCEHLTLGCHIVVPPWPRSVVWYNKEGKVEPGERYHVLEDGVGGYLLEIPVAEWADEGEWKCVATSAGSRVGISTCYVTMDVPKNYRKPRFMENLQAVLTEEGLVSFECKVVGFPTPVLSWFKDGQELKPGDVYQLTGTNSLGSYCCIARNCMGQASSSAELTVEDIQNQLNEEEKLQLFSKNQAPKFLQGLKSVEAKIDEPFRFTVRVAIPPEPSVLWYRDDQPVDESTRCHLEKEDKGLFNLDLQNLEFLDQAEWKCVAMNDFGHSVTSCFLKLIIPRHYKKPRFLENLQAILSDEGAVNLECKVIGVPQPVLKWYKDGEELKPGDIHRIISGQDGTCCLGTYTCEAQNCMGIAASSASLLGFDDSIKTKTKTLEETPLQRNLSLSTIHEERTSQMYDTPVGDITLDDKGEISFSFDGKEVSVSLYETPDLTEEEALQIVEMYADQLSENVTEHNVVELPPLRFVKETSTSGNLLMEAIIIDVSPDYFAAPEEDLRTEADVEDLSIADENGLPQLSLDQDIDIGGEDYLEKTMALLSEEKSDFAAKSSRRKSDSQRSADDFYSLSRDQSLSEEKKDDDTHVSESELQSFASARSSAKVKSKSSKPSDKDGLESSEPTKTILLKEDSISMPIITKNPEKELEVPAIKPKRERRTSRGSRRSSTSSEKSIGKSREELLRFKTDHEVTKPSMNVEEFKNTMITISTSLTKVINDVQLIERDIILKSELMSSAATASRSLEIISSLITPLSEINSIADASKESVSEPREVTSTIFNSIPQSLKSLQQSLTLIEKCIDMESDNKTLVKKTCVAFIEACGAEIQKVISDITTVASKNYIKLDDKVTNEIDTVGNEMISVIKFSVETIRARNLLNEASEIKHEKPTLETKHLRDTQKALFELKSPLNSLLRIVEGAKSGNIIHLSKTKQSEIIMNDMSSSIQDLQTALEQIETLSVKESSTTLHKYNTEIIETVMDSILKLRGSFEQLSTNPNTEEDKAVLQETLSSLKENLTEISCKIKTIDNNVGQFDILQSENKLDVLQKMAQILIALENNLPRLETIHNVKSHMDTFHKNMTKVLENVIESNDAKKYLTMMEICDNINIINSSIKNIDTDNVLLFGSLSNTLKIIQTNLDENVFEPELNCFIKNNISAVLVGIQEAINKAEEVSLQADSEYTRDWSTQIIDEAKVHIVLEHIDQTIAAVNTIKTIESTQELKLALKPAFENICPILEELRRSVASIQPSGVEQDEHISEIADITFAETLGTPLCELNQNIIVLNQLIVENIDYIKDSTEVITAIAVPLQELHTTLEILQQDVISQYGEDLISYEVSVNMASVVQNLQSCIVLVHEPMGIEGAEEMSTLEDISGIKTSADTLPSDRLVLPAAEETAIEQSLLPLTHVIATTATAQTLHTLNEHIMVFQTPEIIEALDTLSEISNYSSLKSVIVGLGDLHSSIDGILHPVLIEDSIDLENTTNISKLAAIAEPLQEIHQSLSILDTCNIPVCENILDLPAEKINSVFQNISELKDSLEQCMGVVLPAMEIASNTIEISNKVSTLREVCKHLNEIFTTSKDVPSDFILPMEYQNLEIVVNSLIDATDTSKDIKIDQVKCITEELYLKVMGIQDEIVQYTTQSPLMVSQEAKLIQTVSEVEANIAVLEQYDFIDLSRTSDITSYMSSQKAIEIDSESLAQIHEIAEDAVNVLQNHHQEIPMADLMIVDDFFKTCKNEFTILRCLISKAPTHKKIIRLLQEFKSLQTLINSFTTKRLELCLSDDINECLTNFLIHADECLRNARTSLVKVVDAQSVMLIKSPITVLESIRELTFEPEYKSSSAVDSVVKSMQGVANISKYLSNNLQCAIIEELSQPNQISTIEQEEKVLTEIIEHLTIVVDSQLESENFDDSSSKVFDKLKKSIIHHQGYKDALGTGKTLIILKCLAECATIVQEDVTGKKMYINETKDIKENSLKEVLAEMLQPLQALQTQLISIQEEVLSGAEEDSISIDITTTESIMQTVTELHKDIVQQIEMDKLALCNEEISLIEEVDKEIHTIQDSIRSMENVQATQVVKEITKPMNEIEKSLHNIILSAETDRKTLSKDASDDLLRHIDQYIELIEIVESISASIKVDDVKESFDIARELKINIINCENNMNEEMLKQAYAEQTRLAQKLQTALSAFQVQVLDSAQELAPILSANDLQRIAQATAQLQANIVAVTSIQVPVQVLSPKTTKPLETAQEPLVSATTSEYLVADTNEFNKIPTSYKGIPVEHVTATTISFETAAIVASQEVLEAERAERVEQKGSDSVAISFETAAIMASQEVLDAERVERVEQQGSDSVASTVSTQKQHHIEKTSDPKTSEVETASIISDASEIITETKVETVETYLENVVGSQGLNESQLPIDKVKALPTVQENLMQHIIEYVSDDIIEVLNKVSSIKIAEELQNSVNIAKELQKCIVAIGTGTKENIVCETKDQYEIQKGLAVSLVEALSILTDDTLEQLHELIPSANEDTVEKIVTVIDIIKTDLSKIVPLYEEHLLIRVDQQELRAQLETTPLLKEDLADTLDQAISEDSRNLILVENTFEALVSLVPIRPSEALAETIDVDHEKVIKDVATEHLVSTETQQTIAKEHTEFFMLEETKHTLPSRDDEDEVNVLEQIPANKIFNICQQATSVEGISVDAILTQEISSYQRNQETCSTTVEATEVNVEMSVNEASKEVVNIEAAQFDLPAVTDEKKTEDLIAKDELIVDSLEAVASDIKDNATVGIETAFISQSTEYIDGAIDMSQMSQETDKSAETIPEATKGDLVETMNQDSIAQLETLLRDVNFKINFAPVDIITDSDNSESLKDTLDEVQTVIIKLKREYDGDANDFLNETLEDLECSVRSVQLQINEESSPQLLTEACATLQLLVDNMNTTQQVQVNQGSLKPESTENILKKCSNETHDTVKLLDLASKLDTKGGTNLTSIIANLKTIKDSIISLRECFLVDADTVIENGIKIIECLNQVEENIFSLERDIDIAENITVSTRDIIVTAVHSVYGSISNMRSAVSSLQKQFMFENYGKPSESLLHSIKHIAIVSSSDDENNKPSWKRLSKSLRKVLNHFEDIKFYINLDKTARLPSDAAFTKIILEELRANIFAILVPRATLINSDVVQTVNGLLKCVDDNFISIESDSSLQVKNKIPMFKNIATKILTTITLFKNHFANPIDIKIKTTEESIPDIKMVKDQELQEMAVTAVEHQRASTTSVDANMRTTTVSDEVKTIKGSNLPSTSDSVTDEISNTLVSLSSAVEISNPLIKHALLVEDNAERYISEMIVSPEMTSLSVHLEKSQAMQFEQNEEDSIIQSMETKQIILSQSVLETSGSHDMTLQASTSKPLDNSTVDKVTDVELLSQTELKAVDKMEQSETDKIGLTIQVMEIDQPTQSQSVSEISGSHDVIFQTTTNKQGDERTIDVVMDVESPIETEQYVVEKIEQSEADKEDSTIQLMEIEPPAQLQSVLETRDSHDETLPATTKIQENNEMVDKTTGQEPPTETEQKVMEKMKQSEVDRTDSTIQSLVIEQPTESQSDLETSGSLEVTLQTTPSKQEDNSKVNMATDVGSPTETELNVVNKINESEADKEGSTVQSMEIEQPAQSQSILETRGSHNESLHATSDIQEDKGEEPPTEKEQKLVEKMKQLEVVKKDSTIQSLEIEEPTQSQSGLETDVKSPTETELNDVNKINQSEADKEGSTVQLMEIEKPAQSQSILETRGSHNESLHATSDIQEDKGEEPPTEKEQKLVEKMKQLEVDKKDSTIKSLEIAEPTQSQSDSETDVKSPTETELNDVNKINQSEADKEGSTVQSMEIEQPAQSQSVLETKSSHDDTLHATIEIQENNKMVDKTTGEEPPTETEKKVVEKNKQLEVDKKDSTLQSLEIEQPTQSQSDLETSGSLDVTLQTTTNKQTDNRKVNMATDVGSPTETELNVVNKLNESEADKEGSTVQSMEIEQPAQSQSVLETRGSRDETLHAASDIQEANKMVDKTLGEEPPTETEQEVVEKVEQLKADKEDSTIQSMDIEQFTQSQSALDTSGSENVILQETTSKQEDNKMVEKVTDVKSLTETKQIIVESEVLAKAEIGGAHDVQVKYDLESSEMPKNNKTTKKEISSSENELRNDEYSLSKANSESGYIDQSEKNVIEEICSSNIQAETELRIEKKYESGTKQLLEDAIKVNQKTVVKENLEVRVKEEKDDVRSKPKEDNEARYIMEQEKSFKTKQNVKENEEKASALKEKTDCDPKSNEEEIPSNSKKPAKKDTQIMEAADKVLHVNELKPKNEEVQYKQEKEKNKTKANQDHEGDVIKEKKETEAKAHNDAELKHTEEKTHALKEIKQQESREAEKEMEKGKLIQDEETRINQKNNDAKLQQEPEDKTCGIIKDEDAKARPKNDAELQQKKETSALKEKVEDDLKTNENQEAQHDMKEKVKKTKRVNVEADKVKEKTVLKLKKDEASSMEAIHQEKDDAETKQQHDEETRVLVEEQKSSKQKQDAEFQQKGDDTCTLKDADRDAYLNKTLEHEVLIGKEKADKVKNVRNEADRANQRIELEEKETSLNQENDDVDLKKKQIDNARAIKEQKDIDSIAKNDANLKHSEKETCVLKEKAQQDSEEAKTVTEEAKIKQINDDCRSNQENNDTELKHKQEDKAHAVKEIEEAKAKEKNDVELKQKEETCGLKEKADGDLKAKEELKASNKKERGINAKKNKEEADKLKQKTELKLKKEEAPPIEDILSKEDDAEAKQKEDEKTRVTSQEKTPSKAKQDAELKEKEDKSPELEKNADADLKITVEYEALIEKEIAENASKVQDIADKSKQQTEVEEKETRLKQENDVDFKEKQADKEHAFKEQEEVDTITKNDAKLNHSEKETYVLKEEVQQDSDEAKTVKEEAKIKQINDECRGNQENNDAEVKHKQKDKARAVTEINEAKPIEKNDAELKPKEEICAVKEKADFDLKEEQEAPEKKEKGIKAKKIKENGDKKVQETKTIHEIHALKENADDDFKQTVEHEALIEKEMLAQNAKKVQDNADKVKQQTEANETCLKQEKDDVDIKEKQAYQAHVIKLEEEIDAKTKNDHKLKHAEEESRVLKEKVEEETKLKLIKQETDVNEEIDNAKLKQKQEDKTRVIKEEKEANSYAKSDAELKQKEEEALALKEIEDENFKKQEERNKKEKAKKFKKVKDADKVNQRAEIKQTEDKAHILKETDDTKMKQQQEAEKQATIAKQAVELKQKEEACMKKEKADAYYNKKIDIETSMESMQKPEEKSRLQNENTRKAINEADNVEMVEKYQEKIEVKHKHDKEEHFMRENKEEELKQKQVKTARVKNANETQNYTQHTSEKNEPKNDIPQIEHKEVISSDVKETKKISVDEISKKTSKYTERLGKSERRDDELHIYKEDSHRQAKKTNSGINHNNIREVNQEQRYIKEYQYEPLQTQRHNVEAREKPRFVDHNHRDYTMEFARPSGYRERSFELVKPDNLPLRDHLGRNNAIYKAQTLVLDSQLRSSSSSFLDPNSSRTSEPIDRHSEIRHQPKAHSEARIIHSDKRTGLSRDSKRKPVFSTYLTDRTAVEGSRVKLTCSVLSSSDPTVTWYKNGVLLDNKLKYKTKLMDGLITLEVLNAVPSDSAEYGCTIQNENGSVSSSANLKVYPCFEASPIPPTFTRSIRDTFHIAENELVLECRIRGQPLPTITWLKDDKSISTNSRYQAYYLADGVCRLAIEHPTPDDSGKYTCKAENSVWSDQITHVVNFTGRESRLGPNIATLEKSRFNRQALESRRPHFTNVLSDYKVVTGGTIGLQVEIRGAPTRVEWLREGCPVTEVYRNAKTFVEHGLYTLALSDVTEKESGMYTCRAWSSQSHVDMNAAITVVQPNELDGKPAIIVGRPEKNILISVGEDVNISFRVQGDPKPKVIFMKGIRDITTSQRACKMTSDDYVKFTLKRSVVSDAGTYCILARNAYGCDRAFVTVVVRQRASSDNLISDWTYPADDSALSLDERKFKSVPERIPGEPCVVEGGNNWISLGWPKSEPGLSAPVLAYKVESWLLGKDGGARWVELGITPLNSFDAFNLKQGEEYHFRVTPRNRYGWGESVQTLSPNRVGLAGDRPEFSESLPGQLKVLVGETANLSCSVKGKPAPELVWMKNGHEIDDEDRRISSCFNGINCSLTIKDINIEDEARYSCEATNVHGRASTYARLAVVTDRSIWEADAKLKRERSADVEGDYPPQFTMRLRDRRVQATYPVRLTCQVIGSPDPCITWFKDGGQVEPDNRRSHFQDEHFHTLELAPTTLEDGGVYEAMARNNSGAVSCRCNLVVDKGIRAYVAPEFCCGLEPLYRLTDGEELRISAVVEAYPSVGVTWYRDGVRLRPSRRAIMTLDRDGQIELALAAVTSRDAGVYSCTASNEVGRASTSGKVEVTGTHVMRTPPVLISPDEPYSKEPMFIRKPRSSEAREGDTVIIACEVVGDPKPDVYWLRDFLKPDYYRDSSHFKRMGDGPEYRFEIPHAKLDYTGAYSVVARNAHGEAKAIISLQILAKDLNACDEAHNVSYGRVEVLPRFSKDLTDLLSCDGDAVEFECLLSGHPEPHVRWFHYHELLRDCSDFETSFDEGTARLKIKQVTADDEGTYTCEAVNNLGKTTSSACLVVYPPGEPNTLSQRLRRPPAFLSAASTPRSTPRSTPARSVSRTPGPESRRLCSPARTLAPAFYTYPFNKVAEEGDSVSLQCAIKGNPAPWATWDKDGVIITPSSRITIKEKDEVLRVLEIDQVTIDDVGVYRITIENEFGRQEASARIEVITQKGKFYAGVRAVSPSPRKSLTYRGRRPSTPRQD